MGIGIEVTRFPAPEKNPGDEKPSENGKAKVTCPCCGGTGGVKATKEAARTWIRLHATK